MTYGPGSIPGLAYKDCNINNLCYTTEKWIPPHVR
jgi:hypothetical protein